MAELELWEHDQTLYLFTSLTAGSSHIVTATSRIETILRANRIPFSYIDTATNEAAKKLFQRRARGKKLPLLVKEGFVLADLDEVEEWNEFGELKENIGDVKTTTRSIIAAPATMSAPTFPVASSTAKSADSAPAPDKENAKPNSAAPQQNLVMRSLAEEAAAAVKAKSSAASSASKQPTPAAQADSPAANPLSKTETKQAEPMEAEAGVEPEPAAVKDIPEASSTSSDVAPETSTAAKEVTTEASPTIAKDVGESKAKEDIEHDKLETKASSISTTTDPDAVPATKEPIVEKAASSQSTDPEITHRDDDVEKVKVEGSEHSGKDAAKVAGDPVVEPPNMEDDEQKKELEKQDEESKEQKMDQAEFNGTNKEEKAEKASSATS